MEERKQSALSRIQVDMTDWAKTLQLEHCDNPYRLDLNRVTVVVDKPERAVPLKQLGSGSNWVGVHLIAYFALQNSLLTQIARFQDFYSLISHRKCIFRLS